VGLAADAGHQAEAEEELIELIVSAKTLIYERAERGFWGYRDTNLLRPAFLDRIERALARRAPD
jgi:hypothetical protein